MLFVEPSLPFPCPFPLAAASGCSQWPQKIPTQAIGPEVTAALFNPHTKEVQMSRDAVVLPGSQRKRADHSPGEGPSGSNRPERRTLFPDGCRLPAGYKSRVYKEANAGTQPPESGIFTLGAYRHPSGPAFAGRQTRGHSRRNPVFSFWGLCPLPRRALSEDGGSSSRREPAPPFFPAKSVYQGGEKKANHFCSRRPPCA